MNFAAAMQATQKEKCSIFQTTPILGCLEEREGGTQQIPCIETAREGILKSTALPIMVFSCQKEKY